MCEGRKRCGCERVLYEGGLGRKRGGRADGGSGSRLATGQEKGAKGEEETKLRGINVIPLSSLSTREAASFL